jgi:RND family efflux transporter MFP subunit
MKSSSLRSAGAAAGATRSSARLVLGLVAMVTVLWLGACSKPDAAAPVAAAASGPASTAAKAAAVRVEFVKPAALTLGFALTGSVEAGRIAQLASAAEGPVLGLRVREGDKVVRGQVLLSLGRSEAVSTLAESLREDLRKDEDNLARTRRLVEVGALPAEQVDAAQANVTRIRSQLARAQESMRDYVVTAPWAGVVSKMKVREGDVVGPRAPLAEIIDPASMLVRVSVPEEEAARLTLGMPARVALDAWPQQTFAARVTRLYPTLDTRTHSRLAELTLEDPPLLLPGMFARVQVVRETLPNAITVPSYSLQAAPGGGMAVFVVQDGVAVRRKVTTGVEVEGRTLVTAGLKAGESLIVAGQETLKDGAPVKAIALAVKAGADGPAKAASAASPASPASAPPAATDAAGPGARS